MEPIELTAENTADFLNRFWTFYDGLVRSVIVDYNRQKDQILKGTGRGVVIVCSVQDSQAPDDNVWVNVTLDIEHVTEFKLIEGNITNVVISGGLSVMFHEDQIYLSIDWEANTLEEFAKSSFLIVGSRCFWTLSEYTRSVTR